jgi:hypothetical protein
MARAAYRLGFVLLAALIAVPACARENSAGFWNIGDGQTIPFSSVAPDVVVPPGERDDSADDPNGGSPDADRGDGPPDDGPPIDQSAGGNNQAIPT